MDEWVWVKDVEKTGNDTKTKVRILMTSILF